MMALVMHNSLYGSMELYVSRTAVVLCMNFVLYLQITEFTCTGCYVLYSAHVLWCRVLQHDDETYRMDRPKQGKLVLICNTKFNEELGLNDRKGTDKDIEAITKVFGGILHFEVRVYKEKKAHEMLQVVAAGLWQE